MERPPRTDSGKKAKVMPFGIESADDDPRMHAGLPAASTRSHGCVCRVRTSRLHGGCGQLAALLQCLEKAGKTMNNDKGAATVVMIALNSLRWHAWANRTATSNVGIARSVQTQKE